MRRLLFLGLAFALGYLTAQAQTPAAPAVYGVGGVFLKSPDPARLKAWYSRHLGMTMNEHGTLFRWSTPEQRPGVTQWSVFSEKDDYFAPSQARFMVNYCVTDLDALVARLRQEGVTLLDKVETYDYGKFVHVLDPDGNKLELFQPLTPKG